MLKFKKNIKPLPDKLSDLLDLAVTDSIKASKTKGVKLDMSEWLTWNGTCKVCMAGAIMRNRLCKQKNTRVIPARFENALGGSPADASKFRAINSMRVGDFCLAQKDLNSQSNFPEELQEELAFVVNDVQDHPRLQRATWKTYRKAAKILREAGY